MKQVLPSLSLFCIIIVIIALIIIIIVIIFHLQAAIQLDEENQNHNLAEEVADVEIAVEDVFDSSSPAGYIFFCHSSLF